MLNPTLIQQFHSSPHAIHNDGSLEQLREVRKVLFPKDHANDIGSFVFYKRSEFPTIWIGASRGEIERLNLPILCVTSFFTQPKKTVKVSDVVAWADMKLDVISKDTSTDQHIVNRNIGSVRMLTQLKQYLNGLE